MLDFKTLSEIGLICGFVGTLCLALPAFKSKFRHLPDFNEDRLSVNSTRTGLILIGLGFLLQFVAIINMP